ncbi:hypothetical protein Tsubulata_019990 [Turnera subulata]|uniref:TF-B3 domain-containing protein n=1 Tax=Turnera subulata TaxID=218843 RepID=A0A9Q0JD73_9ROSI|nr:hypothetical protein Tsubulata_019990 [Turnera subulata]
MEEAQIKTGQFQGPSSGSLDKKNYAVYLISNRREVSEEEKKRAFQSAVCYTSSRPNFFKVMKATNVQKYFAVIIPKTWAPKHLPNSTSDLDAQLRAPPNKKLWPVVLKMKSTPPKLAKGWYKFVMDNNLEKDDACIFELSQGGKGKKESIIFDVLIHRVVNDVVSPTRVN